MFQKFRKVGPKKFLKKYFLRKFFIEFPNKNIFSTNIFEREKIAKCWYFRDFFSRKCGSKKTFVRKFNEKSSKKIFFRKKNRTNFSKFLEQITKLQSWYFSGMVMNINLRACGDPTQLPMLCVKYPISYWIIIQLLRSWLKPGVLYLRWFEPNFMHARRALNVL